MKGRRGECGKEMRSLCEGEGESEREREGENMEGEGECI